MTTAQTGQLRAFTTIILLTLHRQRQDPVREISDAGGTAGRSLLQKAGITVPVTPAGMSNALHTLRAKGWVDTDTDGSRTYSIWMPNELTAETVEALRVNEDWAKAFILRTPGSVARPAPRPPNIAFQMKATHQLTAYPTPAVGAPSNGASAFEARANDDPPPYQPPAQPSRSVPDDEPVTVAGVTFPRSALTPGEAALMRHILELDEVIRLQRAQLDEAHGRPARPDATISDIVEEFLTDRAWVS